MWTKLTNSFVVAFCGLLICGLPTSLRGQSEPVEVTRTVLNQSYDLYPKYTTGDKDYFSFEIAFSYLQPGGAILGQERAKGYFTQEVTGLRPDGAPVFRVVRHHTDLWVIDKDGIQAPAQRLDFIEGHTYEVCFEDGFPVFPLRTADFPSTSAGFMALENIYVSQQYFQTMMTKTHGGIDQLRKIGTKIIIPDSGRKGVVEMGPEVSIEINRGPSTLEFQGIGEHQGQPAAVLAFDVLYLLKVPRHLGGRKNGEAREFLRGVVWASLKDGKVLGGYINTEALVAYRDNDGKLQPSEAVFAGTLERLSEQEYLQETAK